MRLSRSKIELFLECPKCFYMDVVLKIKRPSGYPLTLNNAVDTLLKREFDSYRRNDTQHPIQIEYAHDFTPANLPQIDLLRNPFSGGLSCEIKEFDFVLFGAPDDFWINSKGEYAIVDYKTTAGLNPVTELPGWAQGYRRQISFYAYLMQKNNLPVCNSGYLLYATAMTNRDALNGQLYFITSLIEVDLDMTWIEPALNAIFILLKSEKIPHGHQDCKFCRYVAEANIPN